MAPNCQRPSTGAGACVITPVSLFAFDGYLSSEGESTFDVAPDGKKFLVLGPVEDTASRDAVLSLVQGWRAVLD